MHVCLHAHTPVTTKHATATSKHMRTAEAMKVVEQKVAKTEAQIKMWVTMDTNLKSLFTLIVCALYLPVLNFPCCHDNKCLRLEELNEGKRQRIADLNTKTAAMEEQRQQQLWVADLPLSFPSHTPDVEAFMYKLLNFNTHRTEFETKMTNLTEKFRSAKVYYVSVYVSFLPIYDIVICGQPSWVYWPVHS